MREWGPGDGSTPRWLAKPVPVHWLGWETDTYRLQQAGWQLCMDQCPRLMSMRMVVKHPTAGFMGQTNDIPMMLAREPHYMEDAPKHIWQMTTLGRSVMIHEHGPVSAYANFKAVDAMPRLEFNKVTCLEDLVPFPPAPIVRNQALILPEATVDDLLKEILDRQQDAKMAYFEDLVQREGDAERAPPKFHAQIISLGDYRKAA